MNIAKSGEAVYNKPIAEVFECPHCGCVFYADRDEYYVEFAYDALATTTVVPSAGATYICSCPECHRIVTKQKSFWSAMPDTSTTVYIPPACRSCPTHKSNGGDGICNCTLGICEVKC